MNRPALRQSPRGHDDDAAHTAQLASHSAGKLLLTDREAAAALGVSLRTLDELMGEPWFPAPVVLGPRLKKHVRAELEQAVRNAPRWRPGAQPAPLLRAKVERLKGSGGAAS